MSIRKIGAYCLLLLLAGLLYACGGGGSSTNAIGAAPDSPAPPPAAAQAEVQGQVESTIGVALNGVAVSVIGTSVTTQSDLNGELKLELDSSKTHTLKFVKEGYAEQFKVLTLARDAKVIPISVQMLRLEPFQTLAGAQSGGNVSGKDGAKLELPAGALVDAGGQAVTGAIQVSLTPVNVTTGDLGGFPGAFAGIPQGGAEGAIESYGTTFFELRQNGQKLNLASGQTAVIELPLYVTQGVNIGDTIALWSLNETTAVWQQEGTGVVVTSTASPTGMALRGKVSHFSPWNADRIQGERGTLNITFQAPTGFTLPPSVALTAQTAGAVPAWSSAGQARAPVDTAPVPANRSIRLQGLGMLVGANGVARTSRGSLITSVLPNQTRAVTMLLEPVNMPVLRILRPDQAVTSVNANTATLTVDVKLDAELPFQTAPVPDRVQLVANGAIIGDQAPDLTTLNRFAWDLTGMPEGQYRVVARAVKGLDRSESQPRTVIVDRTQPQMTAFAPASSAEVDRNTVFTVDFSEPVNALPFTLADAVKLTVVPTGSTTPVAIASVAVLDAAGTRLTVIASVALPIGVAGLSWGGLSDAATNPITGTVAATWNVSRSTSLGADFGRNDQTAQPIAVNASGVVHILHEKIVTGQIYGGDLQVLRFDGNQFVAMGPVINDRRTGQHYALSIDASGAVLVAFAQADSTGLNSEVLVRRYDSASNTWQTLGPTFAGPTQSIDSANLQLALAIDGQNRPVLVFKKSGVGSGGLEGHRFSGTSWSALGVINPGSSLAGAGLAITIDGANRPLVAYTISPFPFVVAMDVSRHDGNSWVNLGRIDIVGNSGVLGQPALALAADGQPWVAWRNFCCSAVQLKRFDGSTFVAVPIAPAFNASNQAYEMTFLNGNPVLAAFSGENAGVQVIRLRNGAWEPPTVVRTPEPRFVRMQPGPGNTVFMSLSIVGSQARVTQLAFP